MTHIEQHAFSFHKIQALKSIENNNFHKNAIYKALDLFLTFLHAIFISLSITSYIELLGKKSFVIIVLTLIVIFDKSGGLPSKLQFSVNSPKLLLYSYL